MYLVVEFIQEGNAEVIPSSWFNEQDCIASSSSFFIARFSVWVAGAVAQD